MIKYVIFGIIGLVILFSLQNAYADNELLPSQEPNVNDMYYTFSTLVNDERFEESLIYADMILEKYPNNLDILTNKAGILIKLERYSESLIISNKVLEIEPDKISTLTNKAIALKMLKKYEETFLTFTKILMLTPEDETVQKARANVLSQTPTINTVYSETLDIPSFISNSEESYKIIVQYEVHALVTLRNNAGELIGVTESTNSRFLPSVFTEKWWETLDNNGKIEHVDGVQIFRITNNMINQDDFIGQVHVEREMSGYKINMFQTFLPMIEIEKTDTSTVQWTIIKK